MFIKKQYFLVNLCCFMCEVLKNKARNVHNTTDIRNKNKVKQETVTLIYTNNITCENKALFLFMLINYQTRD